MCTHRRLSTLKISGIQPHQRHVHMYTPPPPQANIFLYWYIVYTNGKQVRVG
jgi:hypothetical protein